MQLYVFDACETNGLIKFVQRSGSPVGSYYREFYLRHGLDAETTGIVSARGHEYLKMVTGLPTTFRRLIAGDTLNLGGRVFSVHTGDGHAPEQVMLYYSADL